MSERFCGRSDWLVNPGSASASRDAKPGPALGSPRAKAALCEWIERHYNRGWAAVVALPDACEHLAQCDEPLPGGIKGRLHMGPAVTYRAAIARLRAELAVLEWLSTGAAQAIKDGHLRGELDTAADWATLVPESICVGLGMSGAASFAAVAAHVRERILARRTD